MARLILAVSGPLAMLATTAMLSVHVSVAVLFDHAPTKAVSGLAAALEAVLLLALGYLYSIHTVAFMRRKFGGQSGAGAPFGIGIFAATLTAASSVATIISLHKAPTGLARDPVVSGKGFLVGICALLAISFAAQVTFMAIHFISSRAAGRPVGLCGESHNDDDESSVSYVKSVRYSQTSPISSMALGRGNSMASTERPYSSAEKSYLVATGSVRSSMSKEVRPMNSQTKLVSLREKRRAPSMDSYRNSVEDGYSLDEFPSFDKQIDNACALPRPVFLETIPASPTLASRSSSPSLSDLEPPRMARSRSYSPVARVRERNSSVLSVASSEAHIHPLFRSDSPTPPPLATPGTNVLASPNAGQVIPHRQSVRDLKRMRSGSLPPAPSPLSHQNSTDNLDLKKVRDEQISIQEIREEEEEAVRSTETPDADTELPPPIPGWVLTAGCRNSLTDYNSRKLKVEDN